MRPAIEIVIPINAHSVAIAQARAFAEVSRALAARIEVDALGHEHLLAYLVNAGLAAELHFKSLMIAARSGRVTKGHDLGLLYREFPEFLSNFLEWQFTQLMPPNGWRVTFTALTFRARTPPRPDPTPIPGYGTFREAASSCSRIFEEGRYFFETVHEADWAVFAYAPDAIDAILVALDRAYVHFLAGDFGPK